MIPKFFSRPLTAATSVAAILPVPSRVVVSLVVGPVAVAAVTGVATVAMSCLATWPPLPNLPLSGRYLQVELQGVSHPLSPLLPELAELQVRFLPSCVASWPLKAWASFSFRFSAILAIVYTSLRLLNRRVFSLLVSMMALDPPSWSKT
jgi:hypothetical protein